MFESSWATSRRFEFIQFKMGLPIPPLVPTGRLDLKSQYSTRLEEKPHGRWFVI